MSDTEDNPNTEALIMQQLTEDKSIYDDKTQELHERYDVHIATDRSELFYREMRERSKDWKKANDSILLCYARCLGLKPAEEELHFQ